MANPNNCATCDHKRDPDGGWCYMFRAEPTEVCMQHTGRQSLPIIQVHPGVFPDWLHDAMKPLSGRAEP
jgi:hypothetical protein